MTSPLLGVHGRHDTDPADSRAGIVVSAEMDHQNGEPYLWVFLDTPKSDGAAFDYVPLSCFAPTDPKALRQRLTPRDPIAEARAAGDALGARLLGSGTLSGIVRDAAVAVVYTVLGDYPSTRMSDLIARLGEAVTATALGGSDAARSIRLTGLAKSIGMAVRS